MTDQVWPKVSIVTPSYNQGQFLEETILSVLNQDYPNLEYIVIDGGSTDNSVEIIKKYQDRLAYLVSEPDRGQSDAINKGFRMATGEILAWLNSDDFYLPGTLHTVANYFDEHQDIDCIYGDLLVVNEHSEVLYVRKTIPYDYRMELYGGCLVPQPSSFFQRSVPDRIGYLDTTLQYNMDFDFFVRMGKAGMKFANIPTPLACFRLHLNSKSITQRSKGVAHRSWTREKNRLIRTRYARRFYKNERLNAYCLKILEWFYRAKGFAIRAFTRGDFFPFRGAFARRAMAR